jgi:DNA-binding response OmpR family regulator
MAGIGKRPLLNSSNWRNELDLENQPMLASGRIVLIGDMGRRGPNNYVLSVDRYERHTDKTSYTVLSRLAETPDEEVTYEQLIESVYGWSNPSPSMRSILKDSLWDSVHLIRHELGDTLGDRQSGVIRTVKNVGYLALSEFE